MKLIPIALLCLAGCSGGANQGTSSEALLQNQAKAIEAKTDESVKETINQIDTDAVRETSASVQ